MKILANWFFISLFAVCAVAAEDEDEVKKEGERALMEKHLFPLLMEADHVEILSVYPFPKTSMKDEPSSLELITAFQIRHEQADAKLNDTQKKVLALSREAPVVEGYPVLGKVTISKQEDVKSLLSIIRSNMMALDDEETGEDDCHEPRHALRIIKGEQVIHFSICFDCGNTYLRGTPKSAAAGAEGFRHFKDELKEILEKYFESEGVIYAPYTQKKDEGSK